MKIINSYIVSLKSREYLATSTKLVKLHELENGTYVIEDSEGLTMIDPKAAKFLIG